MRRWKGVVNISANAWDSKKGSVSGREARGRSAGDGDPIRIGLAKYFG
jgi:hypothetical protein